MKFTAFMITFVASWAASAAAGIAVSTALPTGSDPTASHAANLGPFALAVVAAVAALIGTFWAVGRLTRVFD